MKISIIIRAYNEIQYFPELINAIKKQNCYNPNDVEIILVDSGSTDGTLEYGEIHCDKVTCIKKSEFSFGRSLNLGCAIAEGEFLILISAHCVPFNEDWLSKMTIPFKDEHIGVVYGRQVGGNQTRYSEHQIFRKYFPEKEEIVNNLEYYCNNANCAIRSSLWIERQYNEDLSGLEDMDFAKWCINEKQLKINYSAEAIVYHYHKETWKGVKRRFEREANALAYISPDSVINFSSTAKYLLVAILSDLGRSFKEGSILKLAGEIILYRICQYWGSYKGGLHFHKLSSKQRKRYVT